MFREPRTRRMSQLETAVEVKHTDCVNSRTHIKQSQQHAMISSFLFANCFSARLICIGDQCWQLKEDIARNTNMNTLDMFETYGKRINLYQRMGGGVAKLNDFYHDLNIPLTTGDMLKDGIDIKTSDNSAYGEYSTEEEKRNTESGFITLDGVEGCMNWGRG